MCGDANRRNQTNRTQTDFWFFTSLFFLFDFLYTTNHNKLTLMHARPLCLIGSFYLYPKMGNKSSAVSTDADNYTTEVGKIVQRLEDNRDTKVIATELKSRYAANRIIIRVLPARSGLVGTTTPWRRNGVYHYTVEVYGLNRSNPRFPVVLCHELVHAVGGSELDCETVDHVLWGDLAAPPWGNDWAKFHRDGSEFFDFSFEKKGTVCNVKGKSTGAELVEFHRYGSTPVVVPGVRLVEAEEAPEDVSTSTVLLGVAFVAVVVAHVSAGKSAAAPK